MEIWVTDKVGYLPGAVNIGLVKNEKKTYIVDTGIDNSSVNKIIKAVGEISGAIVTHHHADHIGGLNKLEKIGCKELYAPPGELEFITKTVNEPFMMFGGAYPPKILRNRHLEAKPCKTVRSCLDQDIVTPINTPGHTPDHYVYTFDDIIFTGDAAFTSETIEKYKLLFAVNPEQARNSVEVISKVNFDVMIPGHGTPQLEKEEAMEVLTSTARHYEETEEKILQALDGGVQYSDYVPEMMRMLGIEEIVKNRGFIQYILYQVPLMGYLSNLLNRKQVGIEVRKEGVVIHSL